MSSAEMVKADDTALSVSHVLREADDSGREADDSLMNNSGGSADSGLNDSGASADSSDRTTVTSDEEAS